MNVEIALEFIRRRMKELQISDYALRMRHFVIPPQGKAEVDAWNEFFVLVKETCDVSVSSDFGIYDLSAEHANEMQYEHQGFIQMVNHSEATTAHIEFLQVIPKQ
jgi:hypothetical protein